KELKKEKEKKKPPSVKLYTLRPSTRKQNGWKIRWEQGAHEKGMLVPFVNVMKRYKRSVELGE
ncbi:MAG: hypothetical protein Q9206_006036, partial [Seirophora lacunosa]